jgi:RNA polymerase sigma factor (sigma-70 family)
MASTPAADTRALDAAAIDRIRAGHGDAFGEIYDRWFDRVHDLAFRVTRDESAAADVAQDAFVAAWQALPTLDNVDAFGGWLLRITRNTALDAQRRAGRSQPHDTEAMAMIEHAGPSPASAPAGFRVEDRLGAAEDPVRAAEDGEVAALVWDAVDSLGPRDAEVLDLTLRHALTPAEIGEVVGVNRNAANQMVHRARNRLKDAVAARVLWRGGQPECGDLADALGAAGISRFSADAVRVTSAHVPECELCSRRRALRLDPAALFGAVPMVAGPVVLKQEIAHALEADGIPVGESAHAPASVAARQRSTGRRRGRVAAVVGAAFIVVVVALVVAFAGALDDGTVDEQVAASDSESVVTTTPAARATTSTAPATTTAPSPTTTAQPTAPTSPIAPGPSDPGIVTPPPATPPASAPATLGTPPPTTAPPPPASASASVSPATVTTPPPYLRPSAPVLTWTTSGGASVTVLGPGVNSTAPSGSTPLCPNASSAVWSICEPPNGVYTYIVTVRNGSGAVLETATATLTVL